MNRKEGSISRRTFLRNVLWSTAGGLAGGILVAEIGEKFFSSPEFADSRIASEVVNRYGSAVVNTFLDGGVVRNKNITDIAVTKFSPNSETPGINSIYFISTLSFTKSSPSPHTQAVISDIEVQYSLDFALYQHEYNRIMQIPTLSPKERNQRISQNLVALRAEAGTKINGSYHSIISNGMERDNRGNWTDTNMRHGFDGTTDRRQLHDRRVRPLTIDSLRAFGADVAKVLAAF